MTTFVLVGHSYGGMVITGVADRIAERVDSLVSRTTWYGSCSA